MDLAGSAVPAGHRARGGRSHPGLLGLAELARLPGEADDNSRSGRTAASAT